MSYHLPSPPQPSQVLFAAEVEMIQTTQDKKEEGLKRSDSVSSGRQSTSLSTSAFWNKKTKSFSMLKATVIATLLCNLISYFVIAMLVAVLFILVVASYFDLNLVQDTNTIRFYDEVLTSSARIYVLSQGNSAFKQRYDTTVEDLYVLLDKALERLPPSLATQFAQTTNLSNTMLVELETAAMQLVYDNPNNATASIIAANLVISPTYDHWKAIYSGGVISLQDYTKQRAEIFLWLKLAQSAVTLGMVLLLVVSSLPTLFVTCVFTIKRENNLKKEVFQIRTLMLQDTLDNPIVLQKFKEYSQREFSSENILFILAVKEYQQLFEKEDMDSKQTYSKAMEIYNTFLNNQGKLWINLSSQFTDPVLEELKKVANGKPSTVDRDLFFEVEKEVQLLLVDTHMRFKESLINSQTVCKQKK